MNTQSSCSTGARLKSLSGRALISTVHDSRIDSGVTTTVLVTCRVHPSVQRGVETGRVMRSGNISRFDCAAQSR